MFSNSTKINMINKNKQPLEEMTLPPFCIFRRIMVFNATSNNNSAISWLSVLLREETGVPGENHRPVASYWQTLSHYNYVVSYYNPPWMGFELTTLVVISTDYTGICKSNYFMITASLPCVFLWFFVVEKVFLSEYGLWCLTPLSTIFQLYRGSSWVNKKVLLSE